jgi:hypothetical protein
VSYKTDPTDDNEQSLSPKTLILFASVIGGLLGAAFVTYANPENNLYYFILLFVMIGTLFANLLLLALRELIK